MGSLAVNSEPEVVSLPLVRRRRDVWVVVPAFNEAVRLQGTLQGLCRRYPNVVVVDDGSLDETAEVALREPGVWLLRHLVNCGQGAALQTGIEFALAQGARIVVTFDADGQHQVEDIVSLLEPIDAGRAEVVLGSRFLGRAIGMPFQRRLAVVLGILFTRVFSRLPLTDTHNGLRALSRRAAEAIRITEDGMAHASEILDQLRPSGLSYCEVPVTLLYNQGTLKKGQSSWNGFRIVGKMLLGKLVP